MKIAIFSRAKTDEVLMIQKEAQIRDHIVDIINPIDLVFVQDKEFRIYYKEEDILNYDAYIPRYFGIKTSKGSKNNKSLVIKYLKNHGKAVMDSIEAERVHGEGKMYSFFKYSDLGINLIPTLYFYKYQDISLLEGLIDRYNIKSPFIVKSTTGAQGKDIYKVDNIEDLFNILNENNNLSFMIQPYIKADHDLRVLLLKNKILGAMDKIHKEDNFRGNISQGAIGKRYELSDSLKKDVLLCSLLNGGDLVGVDILISDNKSYLLEVNRAPQFKGFSKYVGINVAKEIIKYLELLYLK
jgi:ribosomal protein S6--L-glutamate ligase